MRMFKVGSKPMKVWGKKPAPEAEASSVRVAPVSVDVEDVEARELPDFASIDLERDDAAPIGGAGQFSETGEVGTRAQSPWKARGQDERRAVEDAASEPLATSDTAEATAKTSMARDTDQDEDSAVDAAQPEYVPEEEAPQSWWQRITSGRDGDQLDIEEVPIRVFIGFLPEVSKADAEEFALGVAVKHMGNLGLAYYDAFPADNGYAYEVHEGGPGRAYLPAILKYYKSLGAFNAEDANKVTIHTGTRSVEVSRARAGLSAVWLPEGQKPASPAWLRPTQGMRSAVNKRTGVLVAGAVVFVTGFVAALLSGMAFRLQPYDAAPALTAEKIEYSRLPHSQWSLVEQTNNSGRYVKALRYENGTWRIESEPRNNAAAQVEPPTESPPVTPPAVPAPPQSPVAASKAP